MMKSVKEVKDASQGVKVKVVVQEEWISALVNKDKEDSAVEDVAAECEHRYL